MPISVEQLRDIVGPSGLSPRQMDELQQRAEDEGLPPEARQAAKEAYDEATRKEWAAMRQGIANIVDAQLAPMVDMAAKFARTVAGTQNILEMAAVGDKLTRLANSMTAAIPSFPAMPAVPSILAMPSMPSIAPLPSLPSLPLPAFPSAVTHTAEKDSQSDWDGEGSRMDTWEYKVFETDPMSDDTDETQFNALGEQGWKLVQVVHDVSGEVLPNTFGHTQGETHTVVKYIFMRCKP